MSGFSPTSRSPVFVTLVSLPPHRIILALGLAVTACAAIAVVMGYMVVGAFEAFGATKRYGLPIVYTLFSAVLFLPWRGQYPKAVMPSWWVFLLGSFVLSTFVSIVIPRQRIVLDDLVQGMALICGLLLLGWVGLLAPRWNHSEQLMLLSLLGGVGLLASTMDLSLGPFVTVPIPAAVGLIYAGVRLRRVRLIFLPAGVATLLTVVSELQEEANPSISVLAQLGASMVLLIALLLPKIVRGFFMVFVGVVTAADFFLSSLPELMLGRLPPGLDDVTLVHRGYEAARVFDHAQASVLTLFLGLGPSATVDLSDSPDAETLLFSGRTIEAVDDVHFLGSWVLLKLGIAGMLWLVLVYGAIGREVVHLLRQQRPEAFEAFLLMFVVAGAISGIPAATNFFANPLAVLFLGILIARRRLYQNSLSGSDASSILEPYGIGSIR